MDRDQGYTIFKPTGIKIKYEKVDLAKKQVTAMISLNGDVEMTVVADLSVHKVSKEGSLRKVLDVLPDLDEESYVEQITAWSKIFIEKKITNPEQYFESLS